jgi:CO/xanthine dehydrogenase Mo-binding subunit
MLTQSLSRRSFLKTSGGLVVTFSVPGALTPALGMTGPAKTVALDEVDGFLAIDGNGMVTAYSGKVDLGTGVYTALKQMVAEELSVSYRSVNLVQGDTALTPDQGPTYGSLSIQRGGVQLRQAAATAREALLDRAAERLGASRDKLEIKDGRIIGGGKAVTYGELIGDKQFQIKVDAKAPLKNPESYTLVGRSVRRVDIPAKVTGKFTYIQDFKRDGMLHARVLRPAAMQSTLISADESRAKRIPGYIGTIRKGNFLAVVTDNEWAAVRAADAVKATWSDWSGLPDKNGIWEYVRKSPVAKDEELQKTGNSTGALQSGAKTLSATYNFAIHTHGSMGPSCAVAEYKGNELTVWTASQATHLLRKQLANMLSMPEERIRCIYLEGSGCYGRNGHEDAAADAALLAIEIGKPVRLQWSRADEHGWDPKGPPTLIDYRGALDADGNLLGWESEVYIPEKPKAVAVKLVAAELAGLPHEDAHPGNIHQNMAIPYAVPNVTATAHWLARTPFRASWIRTPGRMQNTFGNECFIDECAAAAGVDPMKYRRGLLSDPRGLELLTRLANVSRWTPRSGRPAASGDEVKGRGMAYIKYELVRTYVGAVADVTVNRRTGKVKVDRFYVSHDCGQIINPDGLKNQIEGNVVQTVSRTLMEDLQFDRSTVTSLDWKTYPILTFPDVPEVVVDLVDWPDQPPWGAGEPTTAVVPSAISNAVFDATGARLRSVPFTPDKVLAALATV